ncbi:MAG: hypothetical protein ACR2PT_08980 [Endozoicomonas sp.]
MIILIAKKSAEDADFLTVPQSVIMPMQCQKQEGAAIENNQVLY